MKSKFFAVPIIIIACLIVCVFSIVPLNEQAYASSDISIYSVTSLDENGDAVDYDFSKTSYGNNISITYSSIWDYISVQISVDNIDHIPQYIQLEDNNATYNVAYDGVIKIKAQAYSEDKLPKGDAIEITVYSDNTAPANINADTSVFDEPTNTPFFFDYEVVEEISGSFVDLTTSYYTVSQGDTILATTFLGNKYKGSIYITDNCTITFYIFDHAKNSTVCTYEYDNFGIPTNEVPTIILSNNNNTYAKQVSVTISWGADYDAHPDTLKYYKITTANGEIEKRKYEGAFIVTNNNTTVSAIYYIDGAEKQVDVVVTHIDKIAPSSEMLMKNFVILCDITEAKPFSVKVTVADSESGVAIV